MHYLYASEGALHVLVVMFLLHYYVHLKEKIMLKKAILKKYHASIQVAAEKSWIYILAIKS